MNKIYTWIYKKWVECDENTFAGKLLYRIRDYILKFANPIVEYNINGEMVKMPFSQMTPLYMKKFNKYDRQLSKICRFVCEKKNKKLDIIDVGANIGDTVINIGLKNARYLLVEGAEMYAELIKFNLEGKYEYNLVNCFLGDEQTERDYKLEIKKGTASLKKCSDEKNEFAILDNIVEEIDFKPDILKIDTDGFDFKVLRGSKKILSTYSPVLFFEWTLEELQSNGENPVSIFKLLNELGYKKIILFDNFGELMITLNTDELQQLEMLMLYTKTGRINYYDICAINESANYDVDEVVNYLANTLRKEG